MNEKEARRILDVAPNATLQECKKSMIKQQKAFHPNFAKNDDQREVFTRKSQEVNDAYSYIKTLLEKRTQKNRKPSFQKTTKISDIDLSQTITKATEEGLKKLRKKAVKKYNKEYNEKNKEKLKALRKEYQEKSKEKLKEILKEKREKQKKIIKEYKKELKKKSKQTFP